MVCTNLAWASTLAAASRFMSAGAAANAGVSMEAQSKRLAARRRAEAIIEFSPKNRCRLRSKRRRRACTSAAAARVGVAGGFGRRDLADRRRWRIGIFDAQLVEIGR